MLAWSSSVAHLSLPWLSSSIVSCLFVLLWWHLTKSPLFQYIQAWKPHTNPVPLNTKQYQVTSSTSTIVQVPSTIIYQPVPPYTVPVQPSINQFRSILTQYYQVLTSTTLYWPSTIINHIQMSDFSWSTWYGYFLWHLPLGFRVSTPSIHPLPFFAPKPIRGCLYFMYHGIAMGVFLHYYNITCGGFPNIQKGIGDFKVWRILQVWKENWRS